MPWPLRLSIAKLRPYGAALLLKLAIVSTFVGLFLAGDYLLFRRLFGAIANIEALTPFFAVGLLQNLLGMVFLVSFVVLFFSALTASIGSFFSDLDLDIYHAAPVPRIRILVARWAKTFLQSAWVVILFLTPLFAALAVQYKLGVLFVIETVLYLAVLLATPVSLASALIIVLIRYFPVRRVHQIVVTLAIIMLTLVVVGFRMTRPERLFREISTDDVVRVLEAIEIPAAKYYPSGWFADVVVGGIEHTPSFVSASRLLGLAGAAFALFLFVGRAYFAAFVRARESLAPVALGSTPMLRVLDSLLARRDPMVRAMTSKEVRVLTRDVAQWSQLFMMIALLFIYLYNIKTLPLEGDVRAVLVAFANLGMCGFVIAAICLRFAYPSVSSEGRAFWILRTAPISYRRLLWVKAIVFAIPLTILAIFLTGFANVLLSSPLPVWIYTMSASVVMAVTLVSLGVGMGGIAPNFASESPLEVGLSLGGFAYMAISMMYVGAMMILSARPMHRFMLRIIFGVQDERAAYLQALPLVIAIVLSLLLTLVPMELARRRISRPAE